MLYAPKLRALDNTEQESLKKWVCASLLIQVWKFLLHSLEHRWLWRVQIWVLCEMFVFVNFCSYHDLFPFQFHTSLQSCNAILFSMCNFFMPIKLSFSLFYFFLFYIVFFMMIKWYIKPSIKVFCACATGLYQESFVCLHTCRTLENEQTLRRRAEMETAEYKLKLQVISNKYGQVEKELQVSVTE